MKRVSMSLRSAWSTQQVPGSQGYIIERPCIIKKKKTNSTHLIELLNPSNQVRIAGGVLKIDVICRRWGRNKRIRGEGTQMKKSLCVDQNETKF
jgi:hypothetical protein